MTGLPCLLSQRLDRAQVLAEILPIVVRGEHFDLVEHLRDEAAVFHPDRARVVGIDLLHVIQEVAEEGPDQLFVLGLVERGAGRLVHHVPHHDPPVVLVAADHVADVLLQLRPVLLAQPVLAGVGHPVLVLVVHQVGELAEAGIEDHRHHAEVVLFTQAEEVLEAFQEELGVALVDRHLQEDPHRVELQPLGIAQFPVDHVGVVVHPDLHVVAGIGGHVIGASHPREILGHGPTRRRHDQHGCQIFHRLASLTRATPSRP